MQSVADVYRFLQEHAAVTEHAESEYLVALFADLAAGRFAERNKPPQPGSVLAFL